MCMRGREYGFGGEEWESFLVRRNSMVNLVPEMSVCSSGTLCRLDRSLLPITGTSRSSRKMEWYACIEG